MAGQSVVDREVANIVASWAIEGQHCTDAEAAVLHAVAAGQLSADDAIARVRTAHTKASGNETERDSVPCTATHAAWTP